MNNYQPRNINEARLLANINARAVTLWQDGYKWELRQAKTGPFYLVISPEGAEYVVDQLLDFKCECPCYKEHDTCKHSIAIQKVEAEREAAQVAQMEAENAWWIEAGFDSPPLYC